MQMEAPRPAPAWVVPALVAALAVPTFVAFWIGERPQLGAVWAAVQLTFAVVLVAGRRSDTIRLLRGLDDDERTFALESQATAITAVVLVTALAVLFLAAGVRGESGLVYASLLLLLLAELTHLGALAVLNRKS